MREGATGLRYDLQWGRAISDGISAANGKSIILIEDIEASAVTLGTEEFQDRIDDLYEGINLFKHGCQEIHRLLGLGYSLIELEEIPADKLAAMKAHPTLFGRH